MVIAPLTANSLERLKTMNDYYVFDSLPEKDFQDFSTIFAELCATKPERVYIADSSRHWMKSAGQELPDSVVYAVFQNYESQSRGLTLINDTAADASFHELFPELTAMSVGSYIQAPLCDTENRRIGAVCIFGERPYAPNCATTKSITAMADQVVRQLERIKKISELKQLELEQRNAYADLEKFSSVASHDLRSPLNNIISLTNLINDQYADVLDEDGKEYLAYLSNASRQLADLVSGILEYSKSSRLLVDNKELVDVDELIGEVFSLLHKPDHLKLTHDSAGMKILTSRIAMKQILLNLCDNAIKYNDRPDAIIDITLSEQKNLFLFQVKDNGPGIEEADQKRIFELFERVGNAQEKGGIGVGLSIVKKLVEKLGGAIRVVSAPGEGTAFVFSIPK